MTPAEQIQQQAVALGQQTLQMAESSLGTLSQQAGAGVRQGALGTTWTPGEIALAGAAAAGLLGLVGVVVWKTREPKAATLNTWRPEGPRIPVRTGDFGTDYDYEMARLKRMSPRQRLREAAGLSEETAHAHVPHVEVVETSYDDDWDL